MYRGGLRDKRGTPYHRRHHRLDLIIFKAARAVSPYRHMRGTWAARLFSLHGHALKLHEEAEDRGYAVAYRGDDKNI